MRISPGFPVDGKIACYNKLHDLHDLTSSPEDVGCSALQFRPDQLLLTGLQGHPQLLHRRGGLFNIDKVGLGSYTKQSNNSPPFDCTTGDFVNTVVLLVFVEMSK